MMAKLMFTMTLTQFLRLSEHEPFLINYAKWTKEKLQAELKRVKENISAGGLRDILLKRRSRKTHCS